MAKLGTNKRPIRFRVQTEERMSEIADICEDNDWIFLGGFEPGEPEDIRELEYMLNPKAFSSPPRLVGSNYVTIKNERSKVGRNAPCPCGSGLKYKKCCMRSN